MEEGSIWMQTKKTSTMMLPTRKPKVFYLIYTLSWVFFILALASFLGFMDFSKTEEDFMNNAISIAIGELIPIPDFRTIGLAAIAAYLGYESKSYCETKGLAPIRGKGIQIGGIVCIILTFTPVSMVSLMTDTYQYYNGKMFSTSIVEAAPEEYEVYAFLGDYFSSSFDINLFNPNTYAPKGNMEKSRFHYRICGILVNNSSIEWKSARLTFVLQDADGNDLVDKDGNPVVVRSKNIKYISRGSTAEFETSLFWRFTLPEQPAGFRVQSLEVEVCGSDQST